MFKLDISYDIQTKIRQRFTITLYYPCPRWHFAFGRVKYMVDMTDYHYFFKKLYRLILYVRSFIPNRTFSVH
jgi:hypothetical protein